MPRELDFSSTLNRNLLRAVGGDRDEVKLLRRAMRKAEAGALGDLGMDNLAIATFRRALFPTGSRGATFRDHHRLVVSELKLKPQEIAFRGPPDTVREEHSAFCLLMFEGYQARFLDRHPGETPENYLDRPRKTTLNLTRIVVDILSSLYRKRPIRELGEGTDEAIAAAVRELWSDAWDLELLEIDRYTRLVGTVAVRPFYDPESPGKIRLWPFLSHQLRVIPCLKEPWKVKAVIERLDPFNPKTPTNLWTEKTFVSILQTGKIEVEQHGLGRIPHTWFRDRKASPGTWFVDGRGRGLCDQNAIINQKLTDLNEVFQYQGFSVPEIVNPEEDEVTIGPRRPQVFRPEAGQPFGLSFKNPNAPLPALRQEIEADISNLFRAQRVPKESLGVDLRRVLSGVAIRLAMQPLANDFLERSRAFTPVEHDLVDNALRIRAEHDPGFSYDPATQKAKFSILYQEPEIPLDVRDRLAVDEFEIAQGITLPSEIMRRNRPERYDSEKDALLAWERNLVILARSPTGDKVKEDDPSLEFESDLLEPAAELEDHAQEDEGNGTGTPLLDSLAPLVQVES